MDSVTILNLIDQLQAKHVPASEIVHQLKQTAQADLDQQSAWVEEEGRRLDELCKRYGYQQPAY